MFAPCISNPFSTLLLGHNFLMSFSLLPNPLPSCEQNGFIIFNVLIIENILIEVTYQVDDSFEAE